MEQDSPQPAQPIGNCIYIEDEVAEVICNLPGEGEVLVRNRFGLFAVCLCSNHLKEHADFYKEVRLNSPRRRRKQRNWPDVLGSQTRGRENGTAYGNQSRSYGQEA